MLRFTGLALRVRPYTRSTACRVWSELARVGIIRRFELTWQRHYEQTGEVLLGLYLHLSLKSEKDLPGLLIVALPGQLESPSHTDAR